MRAAAMKTPREVSTRQSRQVNETAPGNSASEAATKAIAPRTMIANPQRSIDSPPRRRQPGDRPLLQRRDRPIGGQTRAGLSQPVRRGLRGCTLEPLQRGYRSLQIAAVKRSFSLRDNAV